MISKKVSAALVAAIASVAVYGNVAKAGLVITEVSPASSGFASYTADWFELTNTGSSAVSMTGYKMDDNSHTFSSAVPMVGISSIAPGESVVYFEEGSTNATNGVVDSTILSGFKTAWAIPSNSTLQVGAYGGSGVGLGTGGDEVNIYNASGVLQTAVQWGTMTNAAGPTLDNSVAQITNTSTQISTFSAVGVNGAYTSADSFIGSPGAVPEPASLALIGLGGLAALRRRRAN